MSEAAAKKQTSTRNEVVWFVARGSVLKGPYSTEQLLEKIRSRELSFLDYCWKQGFDEWRPVASVGDLDRRATRRRVISYPSVEVPSSTSKTSTAANSSSARPNNVIQMPQRRVQVAFAKGRRHSITAYEWAAALVFAVILAYVAVNFALNQIRDEVLARFEISRLAVPLVVGSVPKGVPPQVWSPLYSAPQFSETASALVGNGGLDMPVRYTTAVANGGTWQPGDYEVRRAHADAPWDGYKYGLDPVYLKQAHVEGRLSPTNGRVILVPEAGFPGLPEHP